MATLNLTPETFADIAMIWLFDHVMNPEQINNKAFADFVEKHDSKIKPALMKYYLDSIPTRRYEYKRIKDIFENSGSKSLHQIRIGPEKEIKKKKKETTLQRLAKKAVGLKVEKGHIEREEAEILLEYINNCEVIED